MHKKVSWPVMYNGDENDYEMIMYIWVSHRHDIRVNSRAFSFHTTSSPFIVFLFWNPHLLEWTLKYRTRSWSLQACYISQVVLSKPCAARSSKSQPSIIFSAFFRKGNNTGTCQLLDIMNVSFKIYIFQKLKIIFDRNTYIVYCSLFYRIMKHCY